MRHAVISVEFDESGSRTGTAGLLLLLVCLLWLLVRKGRDHVG